MPMVAIVIAAVFASMAATVVPKALVKDPPPPPNPFAGKDINENSANQLVTGLGAGQELNRLGSGYGGSDLATNFGNTAITGASNLGTGMTNPFGSIRDVLGQSQGFNNPLQYQPNKFKLEI